PDRFALPQTFFRGNLLTPRSFSRSQSRQFALPDQTLPLRGQPPAGGPPAPAAIRLDPGRYRRNHPARALGSLDDVAVHDERFADEARPLLEELLHLRARGRIEALP